MIEKPEARRPVVEVRTVEAARPLDDGARRGRGDERSTLVDHVHAVYEGRWLVAGIALAFLGFAFAYVLTATPVYRANVLLQVEENRRSLAGIEEIQRALGEAAPPGETEMEILRSRMLVGAVAAELGLDVSARPHWFPIVGRAFASRHGAAAPAPAPLGLTSHAWGGDRIQLERLDVSEDLLDIPLRLFAGSDGRFAVADPDGRIALEGRVGVTATAQRGPTRLEIFVSTLVARPGTRFDLLRRRRVDVVEELQRSLRIEEAGRHTGILRVSLDGTDPHRIAAILDAMATTYVRQNVERKSAETAKTLEFLEAQLPVLRASLDSAQAALNQFQVKHGTVNLTAETQSVLQRSVEVERQLTELDMQRSELRQRFTENHPTVTSLREKAEQLRAERSAIAARMRQLPATEIDSAKHQRDVKVANELYSLLLNKSQELRVVKSGTVGNVRILDAAAVPHRPIWPVPGFALGFAALLGLSIGICAVFVRKALSKGADDPEEIERETGLPVYAMVPRSARQAQIERTEAAGRPAVLAAADSGDAAIENLRSLRTSLQFALVESRNNVISIGGPSPGVGKSFVAVNLAVVLASAERRVLLVDADLRRGRLHRHFAAARQPGISDVLSGAALLDDAVRHTGHQGLDMLPTGRIPPNPSELLASHRFHALVAEVSRRYDLVLIDTPPVLAVTDGSVVARLAGVNLLVLRCGEHSIREISLAVKRLQQGGVAVQGAVLNDVRPTSGQFGRFGRYRRYEYRSLATD
jgi:tyrosine-protein kinase Etk/Wzc